MPWVKNRYAGVVDEVGQNTPTVGVAKLSLGRLNGPLILAIATLSGLCRRRR